MCFELGRGGEGGDEGRVGGGGGGGGGVSGDVACRDSLLRTRGPVMMS